MGKERKLKIALISTTEHCAVDLDHLAQVLVSFLHCQVTLFPLPPVLSGRKSVCVAPTSAAGSYAPHIMIWNSSAQGIGLFSPIYSFSLLHRSI